MSHAIRVLVVEDHDETSAVVRSLLARAGYAVAAASTVREAIALMKSESFDALVSEVIPSDGSGAALVNAFRRNSNGPAITVTERGTADDVQRCRAAGFGHHLVRPRGVMDLLPLLANAYGR